MEPFQATQGRTFFDVVSDQRASALVVGLGVLTASLAAIRFLLIGPSDIITVLSVAAVIFVFAGVLIWLGHRRTAGHLVSSSGLLAVVAMAWVEGALESESMFWFPFIGMLALLFLGRVAGVLYATASVLAVAAFLYFDPENVMKASSAIAATGFTFVAVWVFETNRVRSEQLLAKTANFHPLTGLPSRAMFEFTLDAIELRSKRREESYAILFLDVDGLKRVNDQLGHAAGDAMLIETANRLRKATRAEEQPFHISGDEFVILLEDVDQPRLDNVIGRIRVIERAPFEWNARSVPIRISVGASLSGGDSEASEVLASADSDMYRDKKNRAQQPVETPTLERSPPSMAR